MNPKNPPLFRLAIFLSVTGLWMFVFALYGVTTSPVEYGANIGAGLLAMASWAVGFAALVMLILAFVTTPPKEDKK